MLTEKNWFVNADLDESVRGSTEKTPIFEDEDITVNNPNNIVISIFLEFGKISQLTLPIMPEGKYYFEHKENAKIKKNLYVQPYKGRWFLYSVKPVYLIEDGSRYVSYVELTDQKDIPIKNVGEKCWGYVEYVSQNSFVYHNYKIQDKRIVIGCSEDCDIVYRSKKFKSIRVELIYENEKWRMVYENVMESEIAVNWSLRRKEFLEIGDIIFIRGLIVIVGVEFLSINDNNSHVKVRNNRLRKMDSMTDTSLFEKPAITIEKKELFNRLPRRRKPLPLKEIKIEAPPMKLDGEKIPLMLRMGGSMVMGASSLMMGHYTMILSSVLFPVLTSKYTDKQKKEYEITRVEKYEEYLENKKREIEEEKLHEEEVLNYNYPALEQVLTFSRDGQRLWERRKTDDDFLNIRLGNGRIPLLAKYIFPEEKFGLDDDPLENKMYELARTQIFLKNVPIMNSFVENYVCGIVGTKSLIISFLKRLLMQIVLSHSYDEVKTIFLINEDDLEQVEFIKYIPHCWDNQKTFRYLATNTTEAFQIGEYLKKELEEYVSNTSAIKLETILKKRPYYLVFAMDKRLFDSMEVLKDVMQSEDNCGVSVITAFEDLPKECFKIIKLNSAGKNSVIHLKDLEKEDTIFHMDRYDEIEAAISMRKIANTNLKVVAETYELPQMITFLEMFGVGRVEHLNPLQRWKEHNPVKSLSTPVGIGTDGGVFELDLHEKYHGPHGLIAGMTGSGKSEFIISYILSMAINYHPDEVAFLLIDYKGGGLARAFEDKDRGIHLPHLVGTITNLDGAAIQRSLVAIQSENVRRQRIFNQIKSKTGESSIDIYDYQALYRNGIVEEALPHLFIIADEFAELKQQEPEFMDKLISTARIGRSLGVHLILATQKPSGIVNDQIRSNTKFRVCLKVQDKSDSMDMLKRGEAAELKETGRFYLQVGYNEYFALGQSAWSGAQYEPQDEVVAQKDDSIIFLDATGQSIYKCKPELKKSVSNRSQLTEIVHFLSEIAEKENIEQKQLWKDPLLKHLDIQKVMEQYPSENYDDVFIGLIDDPEKQSQYPLTFNAKTIGNLLIVGEQQSGKSTLIFTILYSLIKKYTPSEVCYYILDFSESMIGKLKKARHCGDYFSHEDNKNYMAFVEFIRDKMAERRRLFQECGINDFLQLDSRYNMPLIFIVIDNVNGMKESQEGLKALECLAEYMKISAKYGIKFILSSSHLNEVGMRIKQECHNRIALFAKDKYEYGDILSCRCTGVPERYPGRGMVTVEGRPLTVQICEYRTELSYVEKNKTFLVELETINKQYEDYEPASKAIITFTKETYDQYIKKHFEESKLSLGYDEKTRKPVLLPYRQFNYMTLFLGNNECANVIFKGIIQSLVLSNFEVTFIKRAKNSFSKELSDSFPELKIKECNTESLDSWMCELLGEYQNDYYSIIHQFCEKEGVSYTKKDTFSYMFQNAKRKAIFIENLFDFADNLDQNPEESMAYSQAFIEKVLFAADRYNTFVFWGIEPKDIKVLQSSYIFSKLNKDIVLLFGGEYDRQNMVNIPRTMLADSSGDSDECIMFYRNKIRKLYFPCGELTEGISEEDKDIFEELDG